MAQEAGRGLVNQKTSSQMSTSPKGPRVPGSGVLHSEGDLQAPKEGHLSPGMVGDNSTGCLPPVTLVSAFPSEQGSSRAEVVPPTTSEGPAPSAHSRSG